MPLYEYECENCGEHFDLLQKFSDEPVATHEKCGGAVHRLISASAFNFKGSGWYVTDYAKSGNSPANGAKKDEANSSNAAGGKEGGKESSSSSSETSATPAPAPAPAASSPSDKK